MGVIGSSPEEAVEGSRVWVVGCARLTDAAISATMSQACRAWPADQVAPNDLNPHSLEIDLFRRSLTDVLHLLKWCRRRFDQAFCFVRTTPMAEKHILAVDDDSTMRELIAEYLSSRGFRVSAVGNGQDMARILEEEIVDLVVLDLKLAEEDGLQLVRELRARSNLPIIVITGHRREEVDRIVGLELGADDYLTKPFNLRELLARVRALLRRAQVNQTPSQSDAKGTKYRFVGWELNLRLRRLTSPMGTLVALTNAEFNLLAAFLRAPQQVLSREQLLAATRVHNDEVYDRSIDVQILRLRRKLEAEPSTPELIKTERGVGYIFSAPVEVR
jgi:two-component system OmpR family response regulator